MLCTPGRFGGFLTLLGDAIFLSEAGRSLPIVPSRHIYASIHMLAGTAINEDHIGLIEFFNNAKPSDAALLLLANALVRVPTSARTPAILLATGAPHMDGFPSKYLRTWVRRPLRWAPTA